MTCAEIIARVDNLEPNQYGSAQKLEWLSNLDSVILDECIMTHNEAGTSHASRASGWATNGCMINSGSPPPYNNVDCTLLIADRYGVELYSSYLQMMIAKENSERARYNDERNIYLTKLQEFYDWYNRTHRPLTGYGKTENRLKF